MAAFIARIIAWALQRKPVRAFLLYSEHRGPILADSVTYRTLFSVFAGVLLGFSIAGLFLAGNPELLQALTESVDAAIPGLVGEDGLIDPSSIQIAAGLTVATVLSIIALVGAAIGAIGSLRAAFRTLADKLTDDVLWIWVLLRNFVIAIGIGAAFAASALLTFFANAGIGALSDLLGLSEGNPVTVIGTRAVSVILVFLLDAAAIAVLFRTLSGVKPSLRALLPGTFYGAIGLLVLQQLSSLFVGGASSNPLLASFASLIALLLWFNLSAQVILLAGAYIITSVDEESDRVSARFGASTFAQRRVKRAELSVRLATDELSVARAEEEKERAGSHG
ncbi:YihY/virulence factor BrkB family protein [Microbacterium sp. zg.B48]|uniref:YihY/virulence factor BrkB family protein n=1 Tax=unclassified Microbacterium TaxID=2609290 RepID=UPI00214B8127|nr:MULTISPECIES: YihY/virulence factor BrkB family protein [unclassified Microbacterium]MCR2763400.1 YihY/virulence factor BrkB family protein [Microbacterium sp. zg.B48]MCR2809121.1 YihY/virulence factor BrkB family protein [Microbacterium sp. zg.B185]WIM20274.1 YihY/virulence factor BrkB family protein [Microbacterium sp. zg-B185]